MINLAEYRHSNARLADFLPWAALVDEGIILNKDGSFQRTAKFRGPDLDSAVPAELVGVAGRLNNALRRLGSGWAVFVEAQRHFAGAYAPIKDPISRCGGEGQRRHGAMTVVNGNRKANPKPELRCFVEELLLNACLHSRL